MILRPASRPLFLLLLLAGLSLACASSSAVPGWALLGSRTVGDAVDRDEIRVGPRDGTFRRIKLLVRHRAVTLYDVKVHYAGGGVQDVRVQRQIPAGGETRAIDLNGGARVIEKVVFTYRTTRGRGPQAVVQLYAR